MKIVIVPLALAELNDAVAFYTANSNIDLGREFLVEFERAMDTIVTHPQLGTVFTGSCRRYIFRRFPYCVFYQVTRGEIRIIAVSHQRRRPSYWSGRK